MPEGIPDAVRAFLEQGGEQLVLATTGGARMDLVGVTLPAPSAAGRYPRVLVAVSDRADLRAAVLPHAVRTQTVAVWVASLAAAPGLVGRPEWPAMKAFRAQPVGDGYLVVARFEQPVRVANVVRELGRLSVWPAVPPGTSLVVDDGSRPDLPLEERDVPPDVVLSPDGRLTRHPISGRAPVAVHGPPALGPFDERVLNPIGFQADVEGDVLDLDRLGSQPTELLVRQLRPAKGVRAETLDLEAVGLAAGLAAAGVPVTVGSVTSDAAALLGPLVTEALTAPVDLDDAVAREEHSVVLRRAALRAFSVGAWREELAERAGLRPQQGPTVSVVLATRRPEMLGFALRQVARQRDVNLQLVLAPHGFEPEPAALQDSGIENLVVRPKGESVLFGDVIAAAAEAAEGDLVLKMDDDDWYSSDFVADLLLARSYSGAEVVGTPAEFHYLVEQDVTVRRGHQAELYAPFVAGGTILIERGLLREVGSFRSVRRFVDAQLLAAVQRAGAATYRTHGLGYLLRRNATGHTWQVDDDYLLDPARVAEIRPGFAPSRLLDVDEEHRP